MDRKPHCTATSVITALGENLTSINFYRFCQLIEQANKDGLVLGSSQNPNDDVIRFRPHRGMGFPITEIRGIDKDPPSHQTTIPSIRTTFFGLYGITSPLPTAYIDDIAQYRDGTEALSDFLDIFNHRLTTQFYRIWRKYTYPVTFKAGGTDDTSQYLFGLIGLGISGCASQVSKPLSRFLTLLGTMRLPTRTIEGVKSLVTLLAPNTIATIHPHDPRRIEQNILTSLSCRQPLSLSNNPVLGQYAIDVNSQIMIELCTHCPQEAQDWLPEGAIYQDLMALLHVYLGAKVNARLCLTLPRSLLPNAVLKTASSPRGQLGRTAVMKAALGNASNHAEITINLGVYQRLKPSAPSLRLGEYANYQFSSKG